MKKHSITISGHQTSVSIEDEFWETLCQIIKNKNSSISKQIEKIDKTRNTNLSSAIRLFVLKNLKEQIPKHISKKS